MPEPEPEPSLEDINRCRVPRDYLERWSNEPYFDKAVLGCFVRVMRGVGRGGERVYAMAEIKGVVPYKRRYKIVSSFFLFFSFVLYGSSFCLFLVVVGVRHHHGRRDTDPTFCFGRVVAVAASKQDVLFER